MTLWIACVHDNFRLLSSLQMKLYPEWTSSILSADRIRNMSISFWPSHFYNQFWTPGGDTWLKWTCIYIWQKWYIRGQERNSTTFEWMCIYLCWNCSISVLYYSKRGYIYTYLHKCKHIVLQYYKAPIWLCTFSLAFRLKFNQWNGCGIKP